MGDMTPRNTAGSPLVWGLSVSACSNMASPIFASFTGTIYGSCSSSDNKHKRGAARHGPVPIFGGSEKMRIPLSWLEDYVKIDLPLEELCERLTLGGLEVASVDRIGEEWDPDKIVVGQVVSVRQHPNADRLVLVTVDYGLGEPMEVVTGAPNLKVADSGQKVVFALEGGRLVDPQADTLRYQTLKRSKIRGVDSACMALSEKELGISDDHTGIVILPGDAPVGVPLAEYWGDVVLDLDLTPNLARCFCVTGVAREVAALTGANLDMPSPTVKAEGESIGGRVEIEIEDPDLCPRYSEDLIKGVQIPPP